MLRYILWRVAIMVPTRGLSIPNVPGGVFWDPDADAAFLRTLRSGLRADIPITTHDHHINDQAFAEAVAERLIGLLGKDR